MFKKFRAVNIPVGLSFESKVTSYAQTLILGTTVRTPFPLIDLISPLTNDSSNDWAYAIGKMEKNFGHLAQDKFPECYRGLNEFHSVFEYMGIEHRFVLQLSSQIFLPYYPVEWHLD